MNLILLFDSDFIFPDRARLTDRRMVHLHEVLKVKPGQTLTVGKLNGKIGQGRVASISAKSIELDIKLTHVPPPELPLVLVMALPRPQMLKRSLLCASCLGVKKIIFLNFYRVEKSLWNSSSLRSESIEEQLLMGLEQAKDTVLPQVVLKKRFKPFLQDDLPSLIKGKQAFVAHPGQKAALPKMRRAQEAVLIIGPEGGLVDYELEALKDIGVRPVHLGQRILRFENAIPYAIGKMF